MPDSSKPNVIILLVDSARAQNMSCYGYERPTTPHLERLSEEATVYEHAYTTATWTLPTHASLFTGLYPAGHGVDLNNHLNVLSQHSTLAEIFQRAEYRTCCVTYNPWINNITGLSRGFDTLIEPWRNSDTLLMRAFAPYHITKEVLSASDDKRKVFRSYAHTIRDKMLKAIYTVSPRFKFSFDTGAERMNKNILSWIDKSLSDESPFFLFANYMDVHKPYLPPHSFLSRFSDFSIRYLARLKQDAVGILTGEVDVNNEYFAALRSLYDGLLAYIDVKIGELQRGLADRGLLDNTVFIIVSDHGDHLGEHHNFFGHGMYLYNPVIHIPLIIRYPRRFKGGARVQAPVQIVDIFPTLMEITGLEASAPGHLQGVSLLSSSGLNRSRIAYFEQAPYPSIIRVLRERKLDQFAENFSFSQQAILTGKQKYISWSNGHEELYDLDSDPYEQKNLTTATGIESTLDTYRKLLKRTKESYTLSRAESPQKDLSDDEEIVRRLSDLGYL